MEDDASYYVGFSVFPGIGPVRFHLLQEYFGSAKLAYYASQKDLLAVGLGEKLTREFILFRQQFNIEAYFKRLALHSIRVVAINNANYPERLKKIPDPPLVLYVYGSSSLKLLNHPRLVGVVGTRMITPYGAEVTTRIASDLARAQCVVVSGMAYGVDAAAHWAALKAKGQTIAVLGCGVDIVAPASNTMLYQEIAKNDHGLIISEMPLGHRPNKGLFPARNRIISGLCKGIVVTEGAVNSGSLITARCAAEQGRDVCAVPGPISNIYSQGPAKLIKNGASLVESAADICDVLGFLTVQKNVTQARELLSNEDQLVSLLKKGSLDGNALAQAIDRPVREVFSCLTKLELQGVVQRIGDMYSIS